MKESMVEYLRKKYPEGTKIHIHWMEGEPHYAGKEGVVEFVDDAGQIHGTWGGCALLAENDSFTILEQPKEKPISCKFISVWDDGAYIFESNCQYDPNNHLISNVESVDVSNFDLNHLDKQYLEFDDGSQMKVVEKNNDLYGMPYRYRASNIQWDVDEEEDLEELPDSMDIPQGMDEDEIADYLSDQTGFCHDGFELEER